MIFHRSIRLALLFVCALVLTLTACRPQAVEEVMEFTGERAYADVVNQVNLGPRTPGSQAHAQLIEYVRTELEKVDWEIEVQTGKIMNQPLENIIARRGSGSEWIIIGAHYDSRLVADQDPDASRRTEPVPAANDGAAGVAVLIELARALPADLDKEVWLVFFDIEDQGGLPGWDWILGSTYFAENLQGTPDSVIIVDMIGDADLNAYMERNSDPELTNEIWTLAAELGYGNLLIPEYKYSMIDDHTPFLRKGIRAIDIIDFDYEYWHTTADTSDKVSAASMEAVGRTLETWLERSE